MKKIIVLMPVYNDWESLLKVMDEINSVIKNIKDYEFSCIIINDQSSADKPKIKKPDSFKTLKIINMKKNRGHARCNAFGIRYVHLNENYNYIIVMDSDGEDRPVEIKDLIEKINNDPNKSVVAKRVKRSEGIIFKSLYQLHKFITFVFTGKIINFGNYSCLKKEDVKILFDKASLWSSFSGSVKKNLKHLNEINSSRGSRYFGPSKMSFFNLTIHSFSIIAVFKYNVFFRSTLIVLLLSFTTKTLGIIAAILQILLVIFNLLIFIVSMRESELGLIKSNENVLNEEKIVH